jgi:GAF domain-containing protein
VFDAIVNSAAQLFEPCAATIIILRDGKLHWEAQAAGHSERDFSGAKAIFPIPFDPDRSVSARAILERRIIEIPDTEAADTPEFVRKASHAGGFRNGTYVPLILSDRGIGVFVLTHPQAGFKLAEKQIALAQTFADQAVIAIENARLFNEVQAKTADLQESLQQQTATADVLKVISRSAFDLQAVLGTLTESATELCNADMGSIARKDERGYYHATAYRFAVDWVRVTDPLRLQPGRDSVVGRVLLEKKAVQIADVLVDAEYNYPDMQKAAGYRALLGVPLMRQGQPIGVLFLGRRTVEPFTDKQVELVSTFADQAVIAIQNVELFEEVQAKTRDLSEALTYQTGSSNILRVIASSPSDVGPVLKAIVENACELCDAYDCAVSLKDGEYMHFSAHHGPIPLILDKWPINRNWTVGRAFLDRKPVHLHDVLSAEGDEFPDGQELSRIMGHRTILSVPLVREGEGIGAVTLRRTEVYPFSDKQIALLQSFADQAVIAIENARLFNEVQAKTRDLTESLDQQIATSEVLKAISHSAFDLQPVFDAIAENSVKLCHAERAFIFRFDGQFLRAISSFNVGPEVKRFVDQNPIALGRHSISARAGIEQRTVHVADVHADPEYAYAVRDVDLIRTILAVPMLKSDELVGVITIYRLEVKPFTEKQVSLVETFAAQAVIAVENTRLINELRQSLDDLRATQDRLVQTQKLASLGQLTAGIAHEIKNPLNFVNNFSGMSAELIGELQDVVSGLAIEPEAHADIKELTDILSANLGKIVQHGKRADAIVRSMLLHSGQTSGEHRLIDINALVDESLNRAYYGERAETRGFAIKLEKSFDPAVGEVDLFPREIGRAILNLISNGFYATSKRKEAEGSDYEPVLVAATRNLGDRVEIRIRDNGWGIPADVKEKMFDPFFTTKPAGEGTGLGLSITHDIIVKQHGGSIEVDTKPGEFAEIRLILPRTGALLSEGQ